ncbi:DNA polymerase III subunit delta [Laceyella putida]|uniref:DNA polymerase III subunit delta n=1 Tax=Laceyella putida TaxID=110101 RepID=A0ABW2RI85_9BACL
MNQELLRELKQQKIHPVYFFYGTEPYLIEEALAALEAQLMPGEDEFGNRVALDLEETPIQMLIQEAETLPFFGERRFIIGKNAQFLTAGKGKSGVSHDAEALIHYLKNPLATSVVVLTLHSDQLDKRKKVVKELLAGARTMQFESLKGKEVVEWVVRRFRERHVQIATEALKELVILVGNDLRLLHQECEKLATFVGEGGTVTTEIVSELVPRTLEQDVFKLTEKIAERKLDEAFHIWHDLLFQKEEPVRILALVIRQFRLMLQVKALAGQGRGEREIAQQLKVHPYPVKLALRQGRAFSETQLRSLLALAIAADQEIKSGKVDKELAVERLLFRLHMSA